MSYIYDSVTAICDVNDALSTAQTLDANLGADFGTILSSVYQWANATASYWASEILACGSNSDQASEDEAQFNAQKQITDNATNNASGLVQQKQTDSSDDSNAIQQMASFMSYINQLIAYLNSLLQTQYT